MAAVERGIDAGLAEQKAERYAAWKRSSEVRRAAETARVRYTTADLTGVTHVRDYLGWHKVVRVNKNTVTVETGYSWTDRIPVDRIIEHRTVTP